MKKLVVLLTLGLTGALLALPGCSKSQKAEPLPNTSNSATADNANGGSAAAGPVELKIQWKLGRKYDMEVALNQSTDIKMADQPIHQDFKLTQDLDYSPLIDLDNGGHEVAMKFTRQALAVTEDGNPIVSFDSGQTMPAKMNNATALVAAGMRAMLNVPLDYTFAVDGSLEKIDGVDALMDRVAAAVPDERQRVSLQQLFDEDTLKQYGSLADSLPGHPISIGDHWSSSHDLTNSTGVMTVKGTYVFKDWEEHDGHHCVHFTVTGDIKTKTASASTMGAVVNVKDGTITGDAWFDPDLGMFVDITSDQDTTLNVQTRNMTTTEQQKQTVEMSLMDASP